VPQAWLSVCLAALLAAPCAAGQVRFASFGSAPLRSILPDQHLGDRHQRWVSIERDKNELSVLKVRGHESKAANASRSAPAGAAGGPSLHLVTEDGLGDGDGGTGPLETDPHKQEHDIETGSGHGDHSHSDHKGSDNGDHSHDGAAHSSSNEGGHGSHKGKDEGDHSHDGAAHGSSHEGGHGSHKGNDHNEHNHDGGAQSERSRHAVAEHGAAESGGQSDHGHGGDAPVVAGDHGHSDNGHSGSGDHASGGEHSTAGGEHGSDEVHGHAGTEHGHGNSGEHEVGHDGDHGHSGHGEARFERRVSDEAHSVAVGLVAAVTLIPIGISMALEEGKVRELTLKMLDTFTSIFLAVLWFNTFQQFLITFNLRTLFPGANIVLAVCNVIILYFIAQAISWLWRDETMRLTTFCSCGAHFIAFAGINATGWSQKHATDVAPQEMDAMAVFGLCAVVAGLLAGLFTTNWIIWRQHSKDAHEMNEAIDELEMDIIGLVLSFGVTQAVRTTITGRYPALHHLLLQVESVHYKHTAGQRAFMLCWSLVLTAFASWAMPRLSEWAHAQPKLWVRRTVHIAKVVLIMLVAWGFLLWGQWQFHEHMFGGHGMYGHMIFAIGATFVCLGVLYLMGIYGPAITTREIRETYQIVTTGISLVAAWSWEHCFDMAFDIIGTQYQVGYQGLVPKVVLSIIVPAALMPTYLNHVRPLVLEMDEAHAHEEQVSEEIERISRQSSLMPGDVERLSRAASLHAEEIERLKKDAETRLHEAQEVRMGPSQRQASGLGQG